jgi:DNA-binding MurR/RpiR family transcriptional regulator
MYSAEYLAEIAESVKDSNCILLGEFSFEQKMNEFSEKRIVIVTSYTELESDELLCFVKRALSQGVPVVAITPFKSSRLASWATFPITEGITSKSDIAQILSKILPQDFPQHIIC